MIFLFWLHNLCYAQEDVSEDQAKQLFRNGKLLYEEGEFDSAVLAWERGYELTKLPAFLKNIALAHESNKNYAEAILYLKKYRAFAPFEEQEELRAWLTELESNLAQQLAAEKEKEEAEAVKAAEQTSEHITPVEEKSDVKSVTVEIPPVAAPKNFTVWSAAGTTTFAVAASLSTIQTHRLYTDINTYCDLIDGSGYCSSEVEENDLLNQFKRSQTTSLLLWGASIAGMGLTTWQATKPVQVQVTHRGFMIGGQF